MSLTPQQLDELGGAIARRHEVLEAELRDDAERSRDEVFSAVAGSVTDSADEAQADLISDLRNAELGRDLQELRELEAAQSRMRNGTYGICPHCGGEIALDRLRAQPAARYCVACQRLRERQFAHAGEPKL